MLRRSTALVAALTVLVLLPGTAHAAADLGIVSVATSPNPISSASATTTVTVRNSGDVPAYVVAMRLTPADYDVQQIQSVTCPLGFDPDPPDTATACVRGRIDPGVTVTMTVTFNIEQTATRLASITHSVLVAQVTQTGTVPDPTPGDTTASETVPISYDTTIDPETGRPGTGGGGDGTPTTRAPEITSLTLAPTRFRAAARGPSAVAAARAPVGALVTSKLSAAATLTFRVERAKGGRKAGGRCVAPTRRNRKAPACTRYVTLTGRFTADGQAGTNRLRFTGRLGGLRLAPSRYRLVVTAKDRSGRESAPRRAPFRIVG